MIQSVGLMAASSIGTDYRRPGPWVQSTRMILGILSDTHGRVEATRSAVEMLTRRGARMLIHCGDVGSEGILDCLVGTRSLFVFGNCDWDRDSLRRHARITGVSCFDGLADLEIDGKHLAVIHGDNAAIKRQLLEAQTYDYLLQGHTHQRNDATFGRTRLINPGAIHRANPRSAALLNLADNKLEFIEVFPEP
jgi:uncharacterized protein